MPKARKAQSGLFTYQQQKVRLILSQESLKGF